MATNCKKIFRALIKQIVCFIYDYQLIRLNLEVQLTRICNLCAVIGKERRETTLVTREQVAVGHDNCYLLVQLCYAGQ